MPSLRIEIAFSALMQLDFIEDQTVEACGSLPRVRIERNDEQSGLHRFFIQKRVPHHHPNVIDAVRAEAERQIEVFWSVLSHLIERPIRPTGEVHYLYEGKLRRISPPLLPETRPALGQGLRPQWFEARSADLSLDYDIELLKRLNFARFLDDPVSRYLALYSLLLSTVGDGQKDVDGALLKVDPTIEQSIGPGREYPETTFTRLRNEIAHHREGVSLTETHREIRLQVTRFAWLVGEVLSDQLTRNGPIRSPR